MTAAEHVDVLIVGAGISGIDAAYRVKRRCPGKSWLVLEARDAIGGTWDLFRYPGIRSDSDMYTLGFPFRPWTGEKAIADGASIRAYIEETAQAFGIDTHVRFGHRVSKASWSTGEARWTVETQTADGPRRFTCALLFLGSGYYDYERGYRPDWPGEEAYRGRVVHPQSWPDDLDLAGKRVVVIGSGATAVTLVPALAERAAHVTMLQRSPSYIVARPSEDVVARGLQRMLPAGLSARAIRWKNVLLGLSFFSRSRKKPERVRALLLKMVANELPGHDVERDFGPAYNPWDQRVCLVPDGDLFQAMREGKVEVVTDTIESFTEIGLRLASGREIAADIVVTATGLVVKLFGGIALEVDGVPVNVADRISYKGMMLNDVPNLVLSFGYTNASWTLKSDLTARYACRLINHMDRHDLALCVPRLPAGGVARQPMIDFSSGYVRRAAASLPGQGPKPPWRVHQNYLKDRLMLGLGTITDEAMEFRRRR
ncbi:NAD(P)/FAD-dependent oxidoreductase [Sphingosinicella sp. LHD-64]|uniref:flavin-containing monooxygenase n=1 Tax=Sphingosinicella sp. LHD-64 TaxID=3072139 RepID=UPI00280E673C|nr:NAD(P)/FAD-dependent oxidoreductase [Sphingosinicella sp. LHD-64]MDQ8755768.1 NAD(P)/FAD-dependent oxidoreductase [Sphingosinicella sp. LHD-64]